MTRPEILVLSSTFPQYESDPRGVFLRRHWERYAETTGAHVRVLVPRTKWVEGTLDTVLDVVRFSYMPQRFATLTGKYGILENVREAPLRAALIPAYFFGLRRALVRQLDLFRPKRVVAHMLLPSGWVAASPCRARDIPYELYGHGTDVDIVMRLPGPLRARAARDLIDATSVHLPSREKLERLRSALRLDAGSACLRVETMAHAVEFPIAKVRRQTWRRRESPILFMGRLIRQKGVDTLLRAAALLDPRPQVDIAGEGPERRRLERLASKLAVDARFHGFVQGASKQNLYTRASLLCAPSREAGGLSEGSPLVILEARSHGLPVVASDVGGIPELCAGQEDAILVPPDEPERLAEALRTSLARSSAA